MTLQECCELLGLEHKSIEELMGMPQDERQKYLEEHCWSMSADPIRFDLDRGSQSNDGKIIINFDAVL